MPVSLKNKLLFSLRSMTSEYSVLKAVQMLSGNLCEAVIRVTGLEDLVGFFAAYGERALKLQQDISQPDEFLDWLEYKPQLNKLMQLHYFAGISKLSTFGLFGAILNSENPILAGVLPFAAIATGFGSIWYSKLARRIYDETPGLAKI